MRELKFRLFSKNNSEFLRPGNVGLNLKELQNVCDINLWHVMQYTGLKDKNGVEIYEGDILKVRSLHYEKDIGLDVMCFEKGCFCLRYEYWSDGLHKWKSIENYDSSDLDVVGNVHQNPDLLRKEQ